jgi:hypothetical protein
VILDMQPGYSISHFYGQYTVHKENFPIRGIVTSYNSIVCNSETFIKKLLAPKVLKCKLSLDSQADFKQKFLLDKTKFNENEHRVLSVDKVNMYPNANVHCTISFIFDIIFEQLRKFFKYKNHNGILLQPPTRENLKMFLLETLQKYSIFRSPTGVFKQKSGFEMGRSISASISRIFVNSMEQEVIKTTLTLVALLAITDMQMIAYSLLRKGYKKFLREINICDAKLKFTMSEMNSQN